MKTPVVRRVIRGVRFKLKVIGEDTVRVSRSICPVWFIPFISFEDFYWDYAIASDETLPEFFSRGAAEAEGRFKSEYLKWERFRELKREFRKRNINSTIHKLKDPS